MFKYGHESLLMTYRVHVCMGFYSVNLFLLLIDIKVLRNLNTNKLMPDFLLFGVVTFYAIYFCPMF